MMTMRSHDQFNTTIYGLDDRYRGIHNGRRVVFLNPEDIRSSDLKDGQLVDLVSHFDGEERIARQFTVVPYSIPRRCAATYFRKRTCSCRCVTSRTRVTHRHRRVW